MKIDLQKFKVLKQIDLQKNKSIKEIEKTKKRLLGKVKKNGDGCWEWTGHLWGNGYGRVRFKGKHERAHRIAFMLFRGPIAENMLVCHKCDNPKCINPDHLFLGTNKDNMDDADKKGRYYQKFKKGHIPGNTKLTKEDISKIKQEIKSALEKIANNYDIKIETIKSIYAGRTFKSI